MYDSPFCVWKFVYCDTHENWILSYFKKSLLGFGKLDLFFKVTVEHNCQIWVDKRLVYIVGTNEWNATKSAWISLGKDRVHCVQWFAHFEGHNRSGLKLVWVVGTSVSLKTLLYLTFRRKVYFISEHHQVNMGWLMTKPTKWHVRPAKTRSAWASAQSGHSDQHGRPPSLIRVFAVRSFMFSSCGQWILWSDWADAQNDLSLRWEHMPFRWFCHEAAQILASNQFWAQIWSF